MAQRVTYPEGITQLFIYFTKHDNGFIEGNLKRFQELANWCFGNGCVTNVSQIYDSSLPDAEAMGYRVSPPQDSEPEISIMDLFTLFNRLREHDTKVNDLFRFCQIKNLSWRENIVYLEIDVA